MKRVLVTLNDVPAAIHYIKWKDNHLCVMSSPRKSLWLRGWLHCKYFCPGGHSALLRCWLHLHHLPAPDAAGRSPAVHPGSERRGGSHTQTQAPAQREAPQTDADGLGAARGALPQPHHPSPGNFWLHEIQIDNMAHSSPHKEACLSSSSLLNTLWFGFRCRMQRKTPRCVTS